MWRQGRQCNAAFACRTCTSSWRRASAPFKEGRIPSSTLAASTPTRGGCLRRCWARGRGRQRRAQPRVHHRRHTPVQGQGPYTRTHLPCIRATGLQLRLHACVEQAPSLGHACVQAQRLRYRHMDLSDLESKLKEAAGARVRLIATDGVFSMVSLLHLAQSPPMNGALLCTGGLLSRLRTGVHAFRMETLRRSRTWWRWRASSGRTCLWVSSELAARPWWRFQHAPQACCALYVVWPCMHAPPWLRRGIINAHAAWSSAPVTIS